VFNAAQKMSPMPNDDISSGIDGCMCRFNDKVSWLIRIPVFIDTFFEVGN
jgi:hypothetical protein